MVLTVLIKTLVWLCGVGPVLYSVSQAIPQEALKAEIHFYTDGVEE